MFDEPPDKIIAVRHAQLGMRREVVLPPEVRLALDLDEGALVEFVVRADGAVTLRRPPQFLEQRLSFN